MHDCGNKLTPAWVELALAWTERHLRRQRDTCADGGTLVWMEGHLRGLMDVCVYQYLTCVLEVNDWVSCD
jgi:hypothetical protein